MDFQAFLEEDARAAYQGELVEARTELMQKLASDGFDLSLLRNPSAESRAAWTAIREGKAKMAAADGEGRYNARSDVRHGTQDHGQALLGDAADMLVEGRLAEASVEDLEKEAAAGKVVGTFAQGFWRNVMKRGAPGQWGTGIRNTFNATKKGSKGAKAAEGLSEAEKAGRMVGNVAVPGMAAVGGITALSSVRPENLTVEMLRELNRDKIKTAALTAASKLVRASRLVQAERAAESAKAALLLRKAEDLKKGQSFLSKVRGTPHKKAADDNLKQAVQGFRRGEKGSTHELSAALKRAEDAPKNISKARKKLLLAGGAATGAGGVAYHQSDNE